MNQLTISRAKQLLEADEVVVIPTETVYGLAANIYSEIAIRKVFDLKNRPYTNPLIVHIKSIEKLTDIAQNIPTVAYHIAEKFWPGPLTQVLEKRDTVSDLITANGRSVAVRIPNHPVALELLNSIGFPLAAPSANPFNYLSPTSAEDVAKCFPTLASVILDGGRCQNGIESTVIGHKKDGIHLFRYGSITKEEIEETIGQKLIVDNKKSDKIESPGMLSKHYSPKSKLILTKDILNTVSQISLERIGVLSFQQVYLHPKIKMIKVLSTTGDLHEAAHNFFESLHRLDELGLDCIIAELLPNKGLGIAINDRLYRGASKF